MKILRKDLKIISYFLSFLILFVSCDGSSLISPEMNQYRVNAEKLASEIIEKSNIIKNNIENRGLASKLNGENSFARLSNSEVDFEYYFDLLEIDPAEFDPVVFEQTLQDAIDLANSVVDTDLETALGSYNLADFTKESIEKLVDGVKIENLELKPEYISLDDELIKETLSTMNVLTEMNISDLSDLGLQTRDNGSKGNGFHGLLGFIVGALIFNTLLGAVAVAITFIVADNIIEGNIF